MWRCLPSCSRRPSETRVDLVIGDAGRDGRLDLTRRGHSHHYRSLVFPGVRCFAGIQIIIIIITHLTSYHFQPGLRTDEFQRGNQMNFKGETK